MVPTTSTSEPPSPRTGSTSLGPVTKSRVRTFAMLVYMMRVPLLALLIIGAGLPLGFTSSMLHGVADLELRQVFSVSLLASLLVSAAMTGSFLILLYGEERADGWADRPKPEDRVSKAAVALLYLFGSACYIALLVSVCRAMLLSGRPTEGLISQFVLLSIGGLATGFAVVLAFFLGALRLAKPADDEALEVFAFPLAYLFAEDSGIRKWIRRFKRGTRNAPDAGTFAAHTDFFSQLLARLGPGYASEPSPGCPSRLHSGHRFIAIVLGFLLVGYWLSGRGVYHRLLDTSAPWPANGGIGSVLSYVLVLVLFWTCLLAGLTFFVDRFRFPALAALAGVLLLFSAFGSSDHQFATVPARVPSSRLPTPRQAMHRTIERANGAAVVVAAAGGGIQSAAWTSRVLCGLRAQSKQHFERSVAAISGVSGGSVGTLFYLRCLEAAESDDSPAGHAQDSSLEAVAWGLTHPDLRRVFIPGPSTHWAEADRGWALEHSILKSAHFVKTERRLAEAHPNWPVVLLNSTDAETGDPVVFSNNQFPLDTDATVQSSAGTQSQSEQSSLSAHRLHGFRDETGRDVFLETAARMSAAFPYVSPEARPDQAGPGMQFPHLGDGGYFDNSGLFSLSEWLKAAALQQQEQAAPEGRTFQHQRWRKKEVLQREEGLKRILILQVDAFPDGPPSDTNKAKKWYYQLISPIETMLKVRSESQLVRDETAGKDLQELLNAGGYPTAWLLVRYDPWALTKVTQLPNANHGAASCLQDPPLSWHLTQLEKSCVDTAWNYLAADTANVVDQFLNGTIDFPAEGCIEDATAAGVSLRRCASHAAAKPAQK
jgi:hypothetical protein